MNFEAPGPGPAGLLELSPRDGEDVALFLDLDGTLIEEAPTPGAATAPGGLADLLAALAVVTGREIADLDLRLAPFRGWAAGVHGAEIRFDPKAGAARQGAALGPGALADTRRLAAFEPRLLIEDKGASIAVHFRAAESTEPRLECEWLDYIAAWRRGLRLLRGRKAFEILGSGFSKGDALARFMADPPYAGRKPPMIGDDHTDIPAMQVCAARRGFGFPVAGELWGIFPQTYALVGIIRCASRLSRNWEEAR